MLLIVLALIWVALLAPVVIRRLREGGSEKSIQSFHAEHEVLSRQDYTVAPAHRLDVPDEAPVRDYGGGSSTASYRGTSRRHLRRPRLAHDMGRVERGLRLRRGAACERDPRTTTRARIHRTRVTST